VIVAGLVVIIGAIALAIYQRNREVEITEYSSSKNDYDRTMDANSSVGDVRL
jgi:cell division protein FtsX